MTSDENTKVIFRVSIAVQVIKSSVDGENKQMNIVNILTSIRKH